MRGVDVIEHQAKTAINAVSNMPFKWSINPYRGCYHQCRFCYARKTHKFLEEDGIDQWGSRIYVKTNAPEVVRAELRKRSWKHERIAIGTVTDPYQPLEGTYRITRRILEALRDYETPAAIITRSPLIVRDIDVLQGLAKTAGVTVSVSIATMDASLAGEIEPTVAPPLQRIRAVTMLADAGIPVSVALAPVLPEITDSGENIESVVRAAREAGATNVWHNTLYLHEITREAFFGYLREHKPDLIARYADLYKGTYAPRVIAESIETRVKAALGRIARRNVHPIQPQAPRQLRLV